MDCSFCEMLKFRKIHSELRKDFVRETNYVKLCVEYEKDPARTGEWKFAGESICRRSLLNFCPECGRKIVIE